MSLMYCRPEPVKHPFYVETLRIHIWSSQELCYVIFHNPLLALDDLVDDHLIAFIREELDMEFLAARLEKMMKAGEESEGLLAAILSDCSYYSAAEQGQFRQSLAALKKLSPAEYAKEKGDYLFGLRQYGKAAAVYKRVLEEPGEPGTQEGFLGRIWCNLGCTYARMFQFEKAQAALERAYGELKSPEILKRMYGLSALSPKLEMKERYRALVTAELRKQWDRELEEARDRAASAESVLKLEGLFEKEPEKRMAGAAALVRQWKREYRNMV